MSYPLHLAFPLDILTKKYYTVNLILKETEEVISQVEASNISYLR